MPPINYDATISTVLDEIGSSTGSLGSGAATALVLSIGVECLALSLALSPSGSPPSDAADSRNDLTSRLDAWRAKTSRAFVDDPSYFGLVIEARRRRDSAPEQEKAAHVERELEALVNATGVLVDLVEVSMEMTEDADDILRSGGASHVAGEVATAGSLAQAATDALLAMIEANILTVHRRIGRYGIERRWLVPFREFADRLPEGLVRSRIESVVDDAGVSGI